MGHLEMHVAVNKSRVREYNNTVYLKDNSNFQIELFNGEDNVYAAEIQLN